MTPSPPYSYEDDIAARLVELPLLLTLTGQTGDTTAGTSPLPSTVDGRGVGVLGDKLAIHVKLPKGGDPTSTWYPS